jgi:long-chain acyl-CoA synthetase
MEKPWLKFYDKGVPASIDIPNIPLDQFLTQSATKHSSHPAIIFGAPVGSSIMDAKLTYRELNDLVDRFAVGLQHLGVGRGDRVAIMLPNCPQFTIAAYAIWRIGAVVVCCNPIYVAREVEHLLKDSGAETMIVMSNLYERVHSARDATSLRRVIVTNIKEYFPGMLRFLFTLTKEKKEGHKVDIAGDAGSYWFQEIFSDPGIKPSSVEIDLDEMATLIYSGGTTGTPKGAQLTHRNLVFNAAALHTWSKSNEADEVLLSVMPYFHAYGLGGGMVFCISYAHTLVQIPDPRDTVHVLGSIQKHRATYYPAVPTMLVAFNNFPNRDKYDLSSLRYAVSGAAPLPPEVQEKFEQITGGKIAEAYGLTETSPVVTLDPLDNPRMYSIGVPVPNTNVKIVDVDTGEEELPVGEIGEIIIKGPQVMKGYYNMPAETANVIRIGPDGLPGWFYSGDIGYMDEDGYFHIVDRKKDLIIAGGYNIFPADVEAILYEHPKVKEAAVIGVPDERRGETVKAFIVLKDGESVTEEEIISFCRENMAPYKAPRIVEFREDLPKSLVGKILRRELR